MSTTFSQSTIDAISASQPAWLQAQRRSAWQLFEKLPLPTRRDLDWQRFNIKALSLDKLSLPEAPAVTATLTGLTAELTGKGVIFCDMATALSKHGDIVRQYLGKSLPPDEASKFTAMHNAFWSTGAFLYVPRDVQVTVPLEVTYAFSGVHVAGMPRTLVIVESGAEATFFQKFIGGPPAGTNGAPSVHASGTEVFVKEAGKLHYVSLQNFAGNVFDFTTKRACVDRDAEVDWVIGMFGAAFQRYDVECRMQGQGGMSYMYGVGVADGHQQMGQFTRQHHQTGNTTSDLLFKNVLRDQAVSNYAGMIKVEKDANGTNAYQSNRNLVLNKEVQCDTRPILEIESNKLRCTHGATVGQLDEQQIYYLLTRGLREDQARDLLIEAFVEPVLARIKMEPVYKEFAALIHQKLTK